MRYQNKRERVECTPPAADLDAGRLDDWKAIAAQFALALAALLIACLFAALALVVWPRPATAWQVVHGVQIVLAMFGLAIACLSARFGWSLGSLTVAGWHERAVYIRECREAHLEYYHAAHGLTVEREVSEWELRADSPRDTLVAAIMCHVLHQAQPGYAPWAVQRLVGPVLLDGIGVGRVTKAEAERLGQVFAVLGLVAGRSERTAGNWVPGSLDEVYGLFVQNWRKVHALP
jgi:hypothetical protein